MGHKYSCSGQHANTDNTTILRLISSAGARRGAIYDIIIGSDDSPGDQAATYQLERLTAAGSGGTSFTPTLLDLDAPASSFGCGIGLTGEPTYTAASELLAIAVNQRATFRWIAAPGSELIMPATTNAGIGVVSTTPTSAFEARVTILFEE